MLVSQISPVNTIQKTHSNLPCKKADSAQIHYEQNGLSFAQAESLKSSRLMNKVTFGRIIAPSYDAADVKVVQDLLEKCRYGKKDLIYGDISKVRTRFTDEGVAIEGFYTADDSPDGNIYGICEELAYKVGRRLQKAFGDKYLVFGIHDGSNNSFESHMYLGMLHNTLENQELVARQAANYEKIDEFGNEFRRLKVYKQFRRAELYEGMKKLRGTDLYEQYLVANEALGANIRELLSDFNRESLGNSLLIDPTLGKIQEFGAGDLFENYTCDSVRSLEQVNAVPSSLGLMDGDVPVGYLGDLVPEIANDKNKGLMVYIFPHDNGIAPLGGQDFLDFILKEDKIHPFYKFMVKLNEAFKKSE